MNNITREITCKVIIADTDNWNEEERITAEEDQESETYDEWVANSLIQAMDVAADIFMAAHPNLFTENSVTWYE